MRNFLLPGFLMACSLLVCLSVQAQDQLPQRIQKIYTKAEHHYQHFAYFEAIELYKQFLEHQPDHHESMLKIADSYYKVKDYENTLIWYDSAVTNGDLPPIHEYQYAEVLMNHGRGEQAKEWLRKYLTSNPNDRRAREKLEGLENINVFYSDSSQYKVSLIPINSRFSDFSPALYKEGFIFVSARDEARKKKHRDLRSNGAYLNLYYTAQTDSGLTVPERLSEVINSRFHEGPVALYDSGRKMIFTRNNYVKKKKSEGGSNTVHFQMFSSEKNEKGEWTHPKLLSLHDKHYSMGHPSLSADGKTLYFASNLPDGHGGSDIYKSVWENNTWGPPQNLGPDVNTEGNEMFPHIFRDSILYFASDGFKGLGGLDLFKTNLNAPGKVVNIGYPVNSTKDDFGILVNEGGLDGYFSSNREGGTGQDDIYNFVMKARYIMLAHVLKQIDQSAIPGADVTIVSFSVPQLDLIADDKGIASFMLPEDEAFVIIGKKDGFIGMYTGITGKKVSDIPIVFPVFTNDEHANQLPVVGFITNKNGESLENLTITVINKSTGEKVATQYKHGLLTFFGDKGKDYEITVESKDYQTAIRTVTIPSDDRENEKVRITLEEKNLPIIVRVFKEADDTPLGGAQVRVVSFAEDEFEITANDNGIGSFRLPEGTPFVAIGNKDGFTGMYSGVVERTVEEEPVIHPVPAIDDPAKQLPILGLVRDQNGLPMEGLLVWVTDMATQDTIPATIENGIFYFFGEKGHSYNVKVTAANYDRQEKNVDVALTAQSVPPLEFMLRPVEIYYTVQILALKNEELVRKSFLKNLKGVVLYDGKDGFHRYTYGEYKGLEDAQAMLEKIRKMGYSDAFVRKVERYAELSTAPGEEVDKLYKQMGRF